MKKQLVVLAEGFLNWTGGVDFFTASLKALLATYPQEEIDVSLVFPEKKFFSSKKRLLLRLPIIRQLLYKQTIKNNSWLESFSHKRIYFTRFSKKRVRKTLRKLKADSALFCWSDMPIDQACTIGYYPDLQHRYFPDFFTKKECDERDRTITNILQMRDSIVVHTQDVKKDLQKFFPDAKCKIYPLPFAPILPDSKWLQPYTENLHSKYRLPSSYFMISNQFWIHKGHRTAFEALSQLPVDVHLVCTGKEDDFRAPTYYKELLAYINELGIQDRVHLLGLIPKREQVEIMKGALAVVQPTLFEGGAGGGSVQLAISLGVPVIVSDIPVNKEINQGHVTYFCSTSSKDLAEKMRVLFQNQPARPSDHSLLQMREQNLAALGKALLEAANVEKVTR